MSRWTILTIKLLSVNLEACWLRCLLCGLLRRLYFDAFWGGKRGYNTWSGRCNMLLNNCSSYISHRVSKSSSSLSQKPERLLLFRKACIFCLSVALAKPIHELDAYINLASTTDWQITDQWAKYAIHFDKLTHSSKEMTAVMPVGLTVLEVANASFTNRFSYPELEGIWRFPVQYVKSPLANIVLFCYLSIMPVISNSRKFQWKL